MTPLPSRPRVLVVVSNEYTGLIHNCTKMTRQLLSSCSSWIALLTEVLEHRAELLDRPRQLLLSEEADMADPQHALLESAQPTGDNGIVLQSQRVADVPGGHALRHFD